MAMRREISSSETAESPRNRALVSAAAARAAFAAMVANDGKDASALPWGR
jgi:hypothetical protein